MSELTLTVENDASEEDVRFVYDRLVAHNRARAPDPEWSYVRLFLRDGEGSIRGGLLGEIYFGWLYVSIVWVDEAHRGGGWGKRLLARAEAEAVARGCHDAWLDTFSFQAPEYYQPLGYEVFGALEDYPPGATRYFLRKRLEPG
ncbi:MAG TPA: GNAT family N-acetyltransferase [Longimicrobiaceae bacterium]|nr:GNAT family N-acetyltransferase [Longimicrobiaceae bacterium]